MNELPPTPSHQQQQSQPPQPLPNSTKEKAGRYLLACQSAATQDQLQHELEVLIQASWWSDPTPQIREDLAAALMQTIVGNTSNQHLIDHCLLLCCGKRASLGACVYTLQAASDNDTVLKSQYCALQTAIRIAKKLMCSILTNVEDVVLRMEEMLLSGKPQPFLESKVVISSTITCFVELVLLLPSKIATACHAARVELPPWAVPSKFYSRLLESSFRMITLMVLGGNNNNNGCVMLELARSYFTSLVGQLVHKRRASDEVATALYQCFHENLPTASDDGASHPLMSDSDFSDLMCDISRQILNPREMAILLRSIVRHSVSTIVKNDRNNEFPETLSQVNRLCRDSLFGYLQLACLPVLATFSEIREAWTHLAILSHSSAAMENDWMDRIFCHLIALLFVSCTGSREGETSDSDDDDDDDDDDGNVEDNSVSATPNTDCIIRKHLNAVAATWSQHSFVQNSAQNVQRHVTNFVLSGLWLLSNQEDPASNLSSRISEGVTIRLESTIPAIRKDGMLVAELWTIRLGHELRFDEVGEKDREIIQLQSKKENDESKNHNNAEPKMTEKESPIKIQNPRPLPRPRQFQDPDDEYVSDDDDESQRLTDDETSTALSGDDDDSIWNDGDELVPCDLEDDEEDLRAVPHPCFLIECLEMLRISDTDESAYCRQLTALQDLSSLVRSRPADLADLVYPLIRQLLRMENKFNIDDFSEMKLGNLLSITVEEPLLAGQCLITELFEEGGHMDRLDVLRTLQEAAFELSGWRGKSAEKVKVEESDPRHSMRKQSLAATHLPNTTAVLVAKNIDPTKKCRDELKTRRWRTLNRTKPAVVINTFGRVAPVWFYALVAEFLQRKDDFALWGGSLGAHLLTALLVTLATIVECSRYAPGSNLLAKDLIELVWTFRSADILEVRVAVLTAVAASLSILPEDETMNVMVTISELPQFLATILKEDSDQDSRHLAAEVIQTITSSLDRLGNPQSWL